MRPFPNDAAFLRHHLIGYLERDSLRHLSRRLQTDSAATGICFAERSPWTSLNVTTSRTPRGIAVLDAVYGIFGTSCPVNKVYNEFRADRYPSVVIRLAIYLSINKGLPVIFCAPEFTRSLANNMRSASKGLRCRPAMFGHSLPINIGRGPEARDRSVQCALREEKDSAVRTGSVCRLLIKEKAKAMRWTLWLGTRARFSCGLIA